MARFPCLKFASQILAARFTQLGNDLGVLRCQPILQFIERFDRRKHWHWDFDSVLRHSGSVSAGAPLGNRAASHVSAPEL
jgi:hypothetical protein